MVRIGTDTYLVSSPDKRELVFAIPVLITRVIFSEINLALPSSAGAVHTIIERIKKETAHSSGLFPLSGMGNFEKNRNTSFSEPCTIACSPSRIASHLWSPDDQNRVNKEE